MELLNSEGSFNSAVKMGSFGEMTPIPTSILSCLFVGRYAKVLNVHLIQTSLDRLISKNAQLSVKALRLTTDASGKDVQELLGELELYLGHDLCDVANDLSDSRSGHLAKNFSNSLTPGDSFITRKQSCPGKRLLND